MDSTVNAFVFIWAYMLIGSILAGATLPRGFVVAMVTGALWPIAVVVVVVLAPLLLFLFALQDQQND